MPEPTLDVADDLVEHLLAILVPLFHDARAVVWYDREGALEQPLRAAAARGQWTIAPLPGAKNPLAARVGFERQKMSPKQ